MLHTAQCNRHLGEMCPTTLIPSFTSLVEVNAIKGVASNMDRFIIDDPKQSFCWQIESMMLIGSVMHSRAQIAKKLLSMTHADTIRIERMFGKCWR